MNRNKLILTIAMLLAFNNAHADNTGSGGLPKTLHGNELEGIYCDQGRYTKCTFHKSKDNSDVVGMSLPPDFEDRVEEELVRCDKGEIVDACLNSKYNIYRSDGVRQEIRTVNIKDSTSLSDPYPSRWEHHRSRQRLFSPLGALRSDMKIGIEFLTKEQAEARDPNIHHPVWLSFGALTTHPDPLLPNDLFGSNAVRRVFAFDQLYADSREEKPIWKSWQIAARLAPNDQGAIWNGTGLQNLTPATFGQFVSSEKAEIYNPNFGLLLNVHYKSLASYSILAGKNRGSPI